MKLAVIFLVIAVTVTLSGCNGEEKVQSVIYYQLDKESRDVMIQKCHSQVNASSNQNCINAIKAEELKAYKLDFPKLNLTQGNTFI